MERRANKNGGDANGKDVKCDSKAERQKAAEKRKIAAPVKREVEKLTAPKAKLDDDMVA